MHSVGTATGHDALAPLATAVEEVACRCAARLLITASTARRAEISLLDRVAAGTFSEPLFYRLNIIHLMACDGPSYVVAAMNFPEVHVNAPSTRKLPR
jgi:hypothetical protein